MDLDAILAECSAATDAQDHTAMAVATAKLKMATNAMKAADDRERNKDA
jgi:hypothetical protein